MNASAVLANLSSDTSGYARAIAPREWQFPQDFGAHPDFQTEWWYYTGNVADRRRAALRLPVHHISPRDCAEQTATPLRSGAPISFTWRISPSATWRATSTITTSVSAAPGQGWRARKLSRSTAFGWTIGRSPTNADDTQTHISAATDDVAVDLTLEQTKPPALQGDHGLSAKSAEPGNASYYYSLTRLLTSGTINIGGETFTVSGASWMDHEFGTSALGADALGWDWFGLQLDDKRELMVGQIRQAGWRQRPVLRRAAGQPRRLDTVFARRKRSRLSRPGHGQVRIQARPIRQAGTSRVDPGGGDPLKLTVTPQIADQELYGSGIAYWEGTVRISGDATGYGYTELTGYADSMTGRF